MKKFKRILKPEWQAIVQNLYAWGIPIVIGAILSWWSKRAEWLPLFYSWIHRMNIPEIIKQFLGYFIPALGFGVVFWLIFLILRRVGTSVRKSESKNTKNAEEETSPNSNEVWKDVIITEYHFPPSSLFGLGLKVKNKRRTKIESLSAKLKYVVNTNTKEVPIVMHHTLPWAKGEHSYEYEPQIIEGGKEKDLVVICWNKEDRELWFPTSSLERAKKPSVVVVGDGVSKKRFRIRDDRTEIIGVNFYFEIHFNATVNRKSVNFTWKGYLVYDGQGAMRYA